MGRRARTGTPVPGQYPVRFGTAELLRDLDRGNGWQLSVDGTPQSYVDLDDPTHLEFEYLRRIGDVVDCLPAGPLDVLHVGGGACTLPRYIAATRAGSRQLVIEADGPLIELVRTQLDLRSVAGLRVRESDGRAGLASRRDATADVVVLDAFEGPSVPAGLATRECAAEVARVLRPAGTYVVNVTDGPGLRFARRVVATVTEVFANTLLLTEPAILRGRRFGNLVLAASAAPLPLDEVARRAASAAFPARCLSGAELTALRGAAKPLTDASGETAPVPPDDAFGRRR
jgi:spermidine synthase